MNDKYVKLADVKRKLRYILKSYGVGSFVREKIKSALNDLPYSVTGDLETTLEAADVQPVNQMPVKFEVLGVPVGKGRPKFSMVNGHAVAYTPAKTANYETLVRLSYQQKYAGCTFEKNVPLMADITALFPIPKSASKKLQEKMLSGAVRPTKKPDCDNIIKAVLDALNGVAYYDDSQVVKICIRKRYDTNPRTIIEIIELKEG